MRVNNRLHLTVERRVLEVIIEFYVGILFYLLDG